MAIKVGDRVVLIAKPELTRAELIAIWEVKRISQDYGTLHTGKLSTRSYPLGWMRVYSKSDAHGENQ